MGVIVDRHSHPCHRHMWFWKCLACNRYGRWFPSKAAADHAASRHMCVAASTLEVSA